MSSIVEAVRVVARPEALDGARWQGHDVDVLRIAPDEALGLGATGVTVDGDPDAIIEPDFGWVAEILGPDDLATIRAHTDWSLTGVAGSVVQGKIAGVPAKLLLGDPGYLVTQFGYAAELLRRLGW